MITIDRTIDFVQASQKKLLALSTDTFDKVIDFQATSARKVKNFLETATKSETEALGE